MMLTREECKAIALEKLDGYGIELDKVSTLKNAFVFENSKEEYMGILPIVVDTETGETSGLWHYLGKHDLTMDDIEEVQ